MLRLTMTTKPYLYNGLKGLNDVLQAASSTCLTVSKGDNTASEGAVTHSQHSCILGAADDLAVGYLVAGDERP